MKKSLSKKIWCTLLVCTCFLTLFTSQQITAQKGADVSWVTQMEASGYTWNNACGVKTDLFTILKGYGITSVRLRVWVNPSGGWCGQSDVVAKAKRAKAAGMSVFLSFQFSDTWADPGTQTKPAAWKNYTKEQIVAAITAHIKSVLVAVKATGVSVPYCSVGNETNDGMLWPEGKLSSGTAAFTYYALYVNAAVAAIHANGGGKAVMTLSNPWDAGLYSWNLGGLYAAGGRWDVTGMDAYPAFYSGTVDQMIAAIKANPYSSGAIFPEIGYDYNQPSAAKTFIQKMCSNWSTVYYWEPECYNWVGYGRGAWDPSTKNPTIALQGFGGSGCLKSAQIDNNTDEVTTINDASLKTVTTIYPNPITDNFTLQFESVSNSASIFVYNLQGQVLHSEQLSNLNLGTNSLNLSTSQLNLKTGGTYFLKVSLSNKTETLKLIVK